MTHDVQFYEDEGAHSRSVARFVEEGVEVGELVVVIARRQLATTFRAHTEKPFTFVDAEALLDAFIVDDMPDVQRFLAAIGPTLPLTAPGSRCRVYGEMVDVLCERGRRSAAIALEGLWNELARQRDFTLRCGYAVDGFRADRDSSDFDAICWAHSRTLPPDITFDSIRRRACTSA